MHGGGIFIAISSNLYSIIFYQSLIIELIIIEILTSPVIIVYLSVAPSTLLAWRPASQN